MRIVILIFGLLATLTAFAQGPTTETKDIIIARQRLRVGTDTSKYVTNISQVINSASTHRQMPTAKGVYDALSAFISTVSTDATLSGNGSSGSPLKIAQQSATTGRVLRWNGSTWVPAQVDASGLVNTGASAGSYTAANVTIGPDGRIYTISNGAAGGDLTGPITNLQLIAGAVQTADISNNAISADKIGTGQVTGVKLAQDGATTGQVWKWNGTQWAPGADTGTTYTGGTGISVAGTVITNTDPDQSITNEIELPSQTGNSGKYLTTNGSTPSWATVAGGSGTPAGSTGQIQYNNAGVFGASSLLSFSSGQLNVSGSGTNSSFKIGHFEAQGFDGSTSILLGNGYFNGSSYIRRAAGGIAGILFYDGNILFRTDVSDAAGTSSIPMTQSKMVINQSGNVGFANAAATDAKVRIVRPGAATYALKIEGTTGPYAYFSDSQLSLNTTNAGTTPFVVADPAGNGAIGIGDYVNGAMYFSAVNPSFTQNVGLRMQGSFVAMNTRATGGSPQETARFTPDGLTIGATTTPARLYIQGAGSTSATYILIATNSSGVTSTATAPLAVTDAGWTGFGTNTPQKRGHFIGNIRISDLDTDATAPATSGTTKMVITDANGDLSFANIPTSSSGTVTSASVATANGFSGSVATATTTPEITLSTTVTGLLKGNGTAISAATPGTDFVTPTMSSNQTITTGNFAFMLDASTASSVISNPFTIRGKVDGTNSTQAITFQNAAGTAQSTINITNVGTYFSAVSGKNLILGVGTTGYLFKESGSLQFQNLTVSPSASGNRGGLSYNSTVDRLVYSDGANNYSLATLSDLTNTLSTFASDATPSGAATGNIVDAFSAPRTVTLGSNMLEGRIYTVKGRRNSTNTITVNSESGYTLEIDKDPSIGPTTFNMVSGETITAQRFGTVIIVKR